MRWLPCSKRTPVRFEPSIVYSRIASLKLKSRCRRAVGIRFLPGAGRGSATLQSFNRQSMAFRATGSCKPAGCTFKRQPPCACQRHIQAARSCGSHGHGNAEKAGSVRGEIPCCRSTSSVQKIPFVVCPSNHLFVVSSPTTPFVVSSSNHLFVVSSPTTPFVMSLSNHLFVVSSPTTPFVVSQSLS